MRYFWAGVIGLGVGAVLFISAALVVRYTPDGPDEAPIETGSTPAGKAPAAAAAEDAPAAPADVPLRKAIVEEQLSRAGENDSSSISSDAPQGEQIVAEFVPTIPPPVPPSEPLEIVPGGALNFRSLPSPPGTTNEATQAQPITADDNRAPNVSGVMMHERLRLTPAQLEKVRDVLLSHTIMQSVDEFPVRVGGTVPPNIELTPLPREVADAVPAYANYSYVFTQNQLVIVLTTSREINLLIPA